MGIVSLYNTLLSEEQFGGTLDEFNLKMSEPEYRKEVFQYVSDPSFGGIKGFNNNLEEIPNNLVDFEDAYYTTYNDSPYTIDDGEIYSPKLTPFNEKATKANLTTYGFAIGEDGFVSPVEDLEVSETDYDLFSMFTQQAESSDFFDEGPAKVTVNKKLFGNVEDEEFSDQLSLEFPDFTFEPLNLRTNVEYDKTWQGSKGSKLPYQPDDKAIFTKKQAVKVTSPDGDYVVIEVNIQDNRMPLLKDPNKSSGFNISPMDGEEASPKESIKQGVEKAYLQSYTDLTSFLNEKLVGNVLENTLKKSTLNRQKSREVYKNYLKIFNPIVRQVEEEFSDPDLFKRIEKGIYGVDKSIPGKPVNKVLYEQPYEKELKENYDFLVKKSSGPVSQEELYKFTRDKLISDEIYKRKQAKIEEVQEDIESGEAPVQFAEYKDDPKMLTAVLELGGKQFVKEYIVKKEALSFEKNFQSNSKTSKSYQRIKNKIEDPAYIFDVKQGENYYLINDKEVPENIYNQYTKNLKSIIKSYEFSTRLTNDIIDNYGSVEDSKLILNLLARDYNDWNKFGATTQIAYANIFGGNLYSLTESNEGIERYVNQRNEINRRLNKYAVNVEFGDAFGEGWDQFGKFVAQEISNQLAVFTALAIPKVGLGILGASSFGENYGRMTLEELNSMKPIDYSTWQKVYTSAGYAIPEVAIEYFTTLPLIRGAKNSLTGLYGDQARDMTRRGFDVVIKQDGPTFLKGAAFGTGGEGLTMTIQNIVTGRPWYENVDHALFSGFMFETTLSSIPLVKGIAIASLSDFDKTQGIRDDIGTRNNLILENANLDLKINHPAHSKSENLKDNWSKKKKDNQLAIEKLNTKIDAAIEADSKSVRSMVAGAFEGYTVVTKEQEEIRVQAKAIIDNKSIPEVQKTKMLEDLKLEFDIKQYARNQFKKEKHAAFHTWTGQNKNRKAFEELKKLAEEELMQGSFRVGVNKEKPTEAEIYTQAKTIWNTRQINKNLNKAKKDGLLEDDLVVFKTVQEYEEKSKEKTKDGKLKYPELEGKLQNIQNGSHGFDDSNTKKSYIVVENMAKDDRLETKTHELGHRLLSSVISRNSEAFIPLASVVVNWAKENDQGLYVRLQRQVERSAQGRMLADEVISIFLEEAAAGNINLEQNSIGGIFGFMASNVVNDKHGIDLNLGGEVDAITMLTSLGKKLKAGTLTVKDVKALESREDIQLASILGQVIDSKENKNKFSNRSEAVDAVNKIEKALKARLKEQGKEYTKTEFQKSKEFNDLYESISLENGAINNYIKALPETVEKKKKLMRLVSDRLMNYNPQAKRKTDSKEEITIGEAIMSNVGFAKLDAATEFVKEKEKPTVSLDDPNVKNITNETTKTTTARDPKVQKARVLQSLGNVHLDNKDVISSETAIKIDNLIQENPSDLESKITTLIEKDITKAVKAQMGKISKKGNEVVISEEYKAFIALNYTNIVKSLDVATIKNNYNTLFELTLIGKEDRKTRKSDKPSLKKDSNYRKGIYKIETNKAKFTKYFTEGGYTTLLARQKGLANQIAKGIVNDVVNNRIINESNNNDAVLSATLNKIANNLDRQKDEVRGNYKDQLKYSKRIKVAQIAALLDRLDNSEYADQVFDMKTGKPLKGYKVGKTEFEFLEEVYEPIFDIINDDKFDFKSTKDKLLEKAIQEKKSKEDDNIGDTVERWYYDGFLEAGLLMDGFVLGEDNVVIEPLVEAGFEGGVFQRPDIMFKIDGYRNAALELKAFGNTKLGHNKPFTAKYTYTKNGFQLNLNNTKEKNDKLKKSFNAVVAKMQPLIKYLKSEFDIDLNNRQDYIPFVKDGRPVYYNRDTKKGDKTVKDLKAAAADASVTVGGDFVAEHYNKKGVYYIQIAGLGMFYLGSDPLGLEQALGVKKFEGNFVLQGRLLAVSKKIKINGVETKVGYNVSIDSEAVLDPRNVTATTNFSLDDKGSYKKLKKWVDSNKKFTKDITATTIINNAIAEARITKNSKRSQGITVLDFDDTLATTKSLVKFTRPDGTTGTLNAEEYASTYEDLLDKGYVFDFSDFNKVVKGKLAPLFNKAIKLQGKFGPENMFVLTARPPQSQKAIFDFLKANGLNIPLKNITGLGNSTAEAKALWIADKVGEGYNDFYFADDALQNVQAVKNMLDQFDVKSKVQQARVKFSDKMDVRFNDIIENVTGIESKKRFGRTKARKRGASKGKFRLFIPPSHEDFVGLLYNFMGKGREGDAHRDFLEQALVRPLNRANREYDTARQSVATDYKNLNKQMPDVKKMLNKKTPDGDFVYQDAVRIYLWDKHGYTIPGLSPIDQKNLVNLVKKDSRLRSYAETINIISRQDTYVDPTDGWDSGDIRMDLDDATGRIGRAQFFQEFIENADIIFSEANLNKIEAGFGKGVREALEDMLYRIKTGRNKPSGQSKMVNDLMNWVNGSVGSVMFFNIRSSLLQQMSIVNYINFADNNIFAAAKAFANQKQYWADWAFIFNSDMLKQRRGGIQTDINGAELAAEMRKSKNPHRFLISKLLELGFLPTQIGDNIAIATGGASYYRNRINTYLKQGLSKKEAESKAFTDFQDITQSTQQSARPDMVSQQQASVIGKIILNFQNVTSQFNRLGKKAFLDIKNRRITGPNKTQMQSDISNAARITYYFAVQNLMFYTLQTAMFAMMFDDDEEDNNNLFLKKRERLINGSIDSVLRGSGMLGAVLSTLKNVAIAYARQRDVNYNPDESAVLVEALNFSPVIGIKARKIVNAEKTLNYNKGAIEVMETFDINNPQWSAYTNYIEAGTNIPKNRLYNKTMNVRQGLNNEHAAWERTLMFLGWSQYNLNIKNYEVEDAKLESKGKGNRAL